MLPDFDSHGPAQPTKAPPPLTVTQLTQKVKRLFDGADEFKAVSVVGELSNFKKHSASGHMYFVVKDAEAQLSCVFFKGANQNLTFVPKDGMEVVVAGSLQVYPRRGGYQLYVRRMLESGVGALYLKYEETKKKLLAEGLIAPERRRPLPGFPRRIGLVSSLDSAGLRDVIKVLERRYPVAVAVVEPVAVEGAEAAPSIRAGLLRMARSDVDVVIVGRGGGSIESLWAFNTEEVARAIAAMPMPVISAVGHETDVTIADLVADRRAATPTESAELATPSVVDIRASLGEWARRRDSALAKRIGRLGERVALIGRALRSPDSALAIRMERLDRAFERLGSATRERFSRRDGVLERIRSRLAARSPERMILVSLARLDRGRDRTRGLVEARVAKLERIFSARAASLKALSPTAILARGYAVALANGKAIKSAATVAVGENIMLRLHEGSLSCEVTDSRMSKGISNGQG